MFATDSVIASERTYTGRILIVEDEALLAEEMSDRLMRLGYTVVEVVDSDRKSVV